MTTTEQLNYKVADLSLAAEGRLLIDWAEARMPVLMSLREKFEKTKPLAGHRITGCLHVTKETAVLIRTLRAAGADIAWSGCNPLSTNDAVAAALAEDGIKIFAWYGQDGKLMYPVIAVNDAETKWDFDNVYGTGQSSLDGILRATSVLLAGKNFVTVGYGHCGKGCAMRAKGMGANVITTEVKATAALKATLEGVRVMKMDDAAKIGDVFITTTGMKDVIVGRHFAAMRDGAIVCNTGHYDCELNLGDLKELAVSSRKMRDNCVEYTLENGNRIYVLADGRLVNLAAAEGHPSEVMDMSFANQFQAMMMLAEQGADLANGVHELPEELDQEIAKIKLDSMGLGLDELTPEQVSYATDYSQGT
jgi:adenosylhomocysteinase